MESALAGTTAHGPEPSRTAKVRDVACFSLVAKVDRPFSVPSGTVIVFCPAVTSPANGQVVFSGRTVGSFAKYRCDAGYFIDGPETRFCLETGSWTGEEPTCNSE